MTDKDGYIENVGFLYRTMVERDPSKRRVKPVENHLQLLDFADYGDSSDDSDFQIDDHEKDLESDDQGDSSENVDDDDDESSGTASEAEEKFSPPEVANGVAEPDETKKVPKLIVGDLIERARQRQSQARQRISGEGESSLKLKITICAVCLGDISIEDDEIVECDCCGVSVHEGCYGITDSDSVMSTGSSSSTEPWFCDACRAGQKEPICELCPNTGGIFKETDVGKWVHLVCALYIPGVAFGNVEKLTPVTLFEMPYSRWGAKSCVLCEDERLSRTGVCITCDAGMCKASFHVTCAQREGLLSEASMEEIADPFFAYCKLHADKMIVRSKRRNWLALQSRNRNQAAAPQDSREKARVERKLAWHRERYQRHRAERPPPWVPTQKMARLLTSSPWACRQLLRKAQLMGVSQPGHLAAEGVADARRKWHVPPAFSLEFVSYYLDRDIRVSTMRRHLDELLQQNSELQDQEQGLRQQYDQAIVQLEELKKEHTHMHERGVQYWKMLCDITNKKLPMPEVLEARKPAAKPASRTSRRSDSGSSFLFECGVCKKSQDQHQLAKCDKCQLHYHLYCLDPPLTRMPKKTKSMGWQCSECNKNSDEDKERHCDPNAPRRLRDQPRGTLRYEDFPFIESPRKLQPSRLSRRVRQSRTCIVPDTPKITTPTSVTPVATAAATTTPTVTAPSTSTTTPMATPVTLTPATASGDSLANPTEPADTASQSPAVKRQRSSTGLGKRPRRRLAPEMQAYRKAKRAKRKSAPAVVAPVPPAPVTAPAPVPKSEPSTPYIEAVPGVSGIRMPVKRTPLDKDLKVECKRCGNPGDCTNLVVCDECKKGYHFLCLYPPVRKSPKQRGYTWNCEECNSSDEEDSRKRRMLASHFGY
ncbi:PHD finger protein 14 isoform X1 [Rhipicephalus sanguineus]|uniref:PHD finger protein 14 isoform X1 n=2 Tax=Rhipicephalus sanguineus TaxID=34632 RepID=UPI0018956D0A|nr:PHD finger protein 14 isoform X1 [Rhipicephalus sanguineus]